MTLPGPPLLEAKDAIGFGADKGRTKEGVRAGGFASGPRLELKGEIGRSLEDQAFKHEKKPEVSASPVTPGSSHFWEGVQGGKPLISRTPVC